MSTIPTADACMHDTYKLLAEEVISSHKIRLAAGSTKQHWIAIAGGPGSGKSTLSEQVCKIINEQTGDDNFSVVIPMDGYHISREGLQAISTAERNFEDLLMRRGSPWTFDPTALIRDLSAARIDMKGSFPVYSRQLSDPVPDGVQVFFL
jgi:pantothenate kinase